MTLTQIEMTMVGLDSIAHAGKRQSKRIKDIIKLMIISVAEHDEMMAVPEWRANYIAFLGQDGLDLACATRDKFKITLDSLVTEGLILEEELQVIMSKD